ncbi:MAG: 6,7-dimethyl-8-ribityllumazine synthase [Bacteroidales bacterium]|nr:6,7-dimethyl-8-ribityllumazine synthase [Bacteroidales bacterium]
MKKTNLSDYDASQVPSGNGRKIGVVAAEWNAEITDALLDGAVQTLLANGVAEDDLMVRRVPGTFELPTAADWMLQAHQLDAVICIGCVIQGETRHFEFICQAVSQGLMNVSLKHERPVIFSVLTTDTFDQAKQRSGGRHGNKGVEGAVTALKMCALCE